MNQTSNAMFKREVEYDDICVSETQPYKKHNTCVSISSVIISFPISPQKVLLPCSWKLCFVDNRFAWKWDTNQSLCRRHFSSKENQNQIKNERLVCIPNDLLLVYRVYENKINIPLFRTVRQPETIQKRSSCRKTTQRRSSQ